MECPTPSHRLTVLVAFPVYKIDMLFPEYEKYTETELIKLIKQLERRKQDLISQLKNVQYQTDKESKVRKAQVQS